MNLCPKVFCCGCFSALWLLPVQGADDAGDKPPPPEPVSITKDDDVKKVAAAEKPQVVDEVTVKGVTLKGQILQFGDDGISLRTQYGSGDILIKYEDVESIVAFGTYRFVERNGRDTHGRIVNFSKTSLTIETLEGKVVVIQRDNISRVVRDNTEAKTIIGRLKNRFPFTNVKVDFSWNIENGSVKKTMIEFGINIERRKAPTRLVLDASASYEDDENTETGTEVISKDEYHASFVGEYDIGKKWYAFLFPMADHDAPRGIDLRFYPATGIGYRFAESKRWRIQVQVGIAYVYEEFTDYEKNKYWAGHIGTEWGYTFKNGNTIVGKLYYYPGLSDPNKNWLFRGDLEFNAKITEFLSFKLGFTDTLDNNPSPTVGDNKFTTSMGLSLIY